MISLPAPAAPPGLRVIGLHHADGVTREQARIRIRAALAELAAALLQVAAARVTIHSAPACAPRILVDAGPVQAGISISHDGDWSFGAVFLNGAVGLDAMRVGLTPDWKAVARDYLGLEAVLAIASAPAAAQAGAFSHAWTALEAHLKCVALPLSEWRPLEGDVVRFALQAPPGFVATVALQVGRVGPLR
ncbi:MAG: 4-phosphopantetheinyl transferase [Bdellovibrionales bacterium]|nr:4-phosphopantetheinyl transferase [Massilia sp.]